jgi:hypothetical protein
MKTKAEIVQILQTYHELVQTEQAALFLMEQYELKHPNFKGIEFREPADPSMILFTAEGNMGDKQIIRIPENAFEYKLELLVNLFAHEMMHVIQRSDLYRIQDRNEREWQAYYEMCFHKIFPKVPKASVGHQIFFAKKGLEYYNRMEKDGELQKKYANQKLEIEAFIAKLEKK